MSLRDLMTVKGGHNPADPFTSVAREVDRIFSDLALGLRWPTGDLLRADASAFVPAVDVESDEKSIRISAELPGLEEKDVQVSLTEGVLTLRGEKKSGREERGKGAYRIERSYGAFERRFALPEDADTARAEATFRKGVLTVAIPRIEKPKPEVKQIPVRGE